MLIGTLIGAAVAMGFQILVYLGLAAEAHRHNTALGGALAKFRGRATVKVNVGQLLFTIAFCALVGAIIGYFI